MNRLQQVDIENIRFDNANINAHTEKGNALTDKSIAKFGPRVAGLLDKNGLIIDGNQRKAIYTEQGVNEVEIVKARPGVPVYVQYDDLDLTDPKNEARELQVALHRSAVESFSLDAENLLMAMNEGMNTQDWFEADELTELLAQAERSVFTPRLDPGTASQDETEASIAKKAAQLERRFQAPQSEQIELACPHCNELFYINKKDVSE